MDPAMLAWLSPEEIALVWEMPALEPPPGVVPDFDHVGGGPRALSLTILCVSTVLATLAVAVRLWSRFLLKSFTLEDGLFVCAYGLFSGLLYALFDFTVKPGYPVHMWNISLRTFSHFLWLTQLVSIFYGIVIGLLKVSILWSWRCTFIPKSQRNTMYWILQALLWANVVYYGVGLVVSIFACWPREKFWNPLFVGGKCWINMVSWDKATGGVNISSDIAILILPQFVIWKLRVSRMQQLGLSLIFALGIIACIAAIMRSVTYLKLIKAADTTWEGADHFYWLITEVVSGFLIMGFPSLPKVAKVIPVPKFMIQLARSLVSRSRSSAGGNSDARRGLPSWHKPTPKKRQADPNDLSILHTMNTHNEMTVLTSASATMSGAGTDYDDDSKREIFAITTSSSDKVESV